MQAGLSWLTILKKREAFRRAYDNFNVRKVARYDEIPVIGPLNVRIRLNKPPKKVTLQPENTTLKFSYSDEILETTIDRLKIHSILVME